MDKKKPDLKKITEKLLSPAGTKILVGVGIAAIALIFFSELLAGNGQKQQTDSSSSASASEMSLSDYGKALEQQIETMIASIDGVGKARVVITFENGVENVYQEAQKSNQQETEQTQSGGQGQKTVNNDDERSTVVVNGGDGGQNALVTTQKTPAVEGVVVVCEGGGSAAVQEDVTEAVSTALDISANHVYVTKMTGGSR